MTVYMVLIRVLPEEYVAFDSLLHLLDKSEKEKIQEAFVAEKLLKNGSNDPDMLNNSNNTAGLVATALQAAKPTLACYFCGIQGHVQANCFCYHSAKTSATQEAQEKAQERKRNCSRGGKNAANNAAGTTDSASAVKEFAGKASLRSTTSSQVSELDADIL